MVKMATDKLGEEEIKTLNNELVDVKHWSTRLFLQKQRQRTRH